MKKTSKLIALLMVFALVFALAACNSEQPAQSDSEDLSAEIEALLSELEGLEDAKAGEQEGTVNEDSPDNTNANANANPNTYADDGNDPTKPLSTANSDDVKLYALYNSDGTSWVVNELGDKAVGYMLTEEGAIAREDGKIIVKPKNVFEYVPIQRMSFDKQNYTSILHAQDDVVGGNGWITRITQYVTNVTTYLNVSPTDATNGVIFVRPSDLSVAEIRANNNKSILAEGNFRLENGEVAIKAPDPSKPIKLVVSMRNVGTVKVFAEAYAGGAKAECSITVKYGEVDSIPEPTPVPTPQLNASENSQQHLHNYVLTVVAPTYEEQGYTLYTCSECGYNYKDDFTAKLSAPEPEATPHIHAYTSTIIPPTETEQGYTLHECSCGDFYKDSYVPALGG